LESISTIVTTIVYLSPPNHDQRLLSEKLLQSIPEAKVPKDKNMKKLQEDFFDRHGDIVCLGKLVPNVHREQDNLIFELLLPDDIEVDANLQEAARILAPFLLVSNHLVFNL
jgi:hypothetical protein